jgi:GPI-anchor transamidase subunit T
VPHARPTMFQSVLIVPPKKTIYLTIDVSKSFLRYTEHPPDAQRGWDLPPAVLVPLGVRENQSIDQGTRYPRIYTPILLVDLATPDFSMPYNVIILSCTLITLIFGSIFNLLTRKFVVVQLNSPTKDKNTN